MLGVFEKKKPPLISKWARRVKEQARACAQSPAVLGKKPFGGKKRTASGGTRRERVERSSSSRISCQEVEPSWQKGSIFPPPKEKELSLKEGGGS